MGMKRNILLGLALLDLVLPIIADQKPPAFVFGGNRLYIGMSKHDAVAALSVCCKLTPPAQSEIEKLPVPDGQILSHFISSKDGSEFRILGTIAFRDGKVLRMTRPLDNDLDTYSHDVVAFVRALKRSIPSEASESEVVMRVFIRGEHVTNAESETIFFSFPNGRGIELHVGTLDKPPKEVNKRDFVSMNETLD